AANGALSTPPVKSIFHGVPVGKTMGIAMGQFVASKPGLARVAMIAHTDDWAKSYCGPATEFLASKNIKPAIEVAFERGQTDATAQTLKIKQANPDFVIACLYEAETAIFLKDAKKFALNAPVMGTAGTDLENTLKRVGDLDTVANYFVPHMYADNLDGPRLRKFADILKKYYPNESVTAFSLISMGGGAAVVEALKRAGRELTREKLIAELDRTKNFDTGVLAGPITWSATDRDGVKEVAVAGFVKGKPTVLRAWGKPL
ncbi:MAG: ABC transporter substrate-binding protein, partial [Pseudomonadota bacterium]